MASHRFILSRLLLLLLLRSYSTVSTLTSIEEEEFNEELLLKPLPDRKVLAHFHFDSRAHLSSSNGGYHLRLFPKSIYQLVRKFRVREIELSFTQGRWNYERWGGFDPISSRNAKPPGVELWAVFDAPASQVDALWRNLTHTLSGLFCASINFLESSASYSSPSWGFRSSSGNLRYGTLPREAVCTENLTPWLKLLPCRDKAGLAELMDRPSIYRGFYHSQRLHLTSNDFGGFGELDSGIRLEQTLTIVLQSANPIVHVETQPSWSISSTFGRKVGGRCVLAKSSNMYLQLDRGLVSEVKKIWTEVAGSTADNITFESSLDNPVFQLSVSPDKVVKEPTISNNGDSSLLYLFMIERHTDSKPFDLSLTWKLPVVWSSSRAPVHASRFLMGSGNERGAIVISMKSVENIKSVRDTGISNDGCNLHVHVFQVVPWYIKVYYHTLQISVDGQIQPVDNIIEKIRVSPSEDKVSPGVLELALKFPCSVKLATLSLDFDKGFLHISEYPPDANQGFDIPSALISFPDFYSSSHFTEDLEHSPIVSQLQERSPALAYTEVLLVPLTTPDFSMPYNVITITCTVCALYFGSLLNVLRRRVGEEERLSKDEANKGINKLRRLLLKLYAKLRGKDMEQDHQRLSSPSSSKYMWIFKVVLVAAIAAAWQYYST